MPIKIKNKLIDIPIIQGAMAIGMSTPMLAGKVARRGGVGTLSMVNPGYDEEDFMKNPFEANKRAYLKDLKNARKISEGKGIILTNLMNVVNRYEDYLDFLNTTEVDGIVVGAGLPLDLPRHISEDKIIAPIVSSERALRIILKKWDRFNRRPDLIILEGPKAGGHLGFKKEELGMDILDELEKILKISRDIPVFVGGGFGNPIDIQRALEKGASGVQIGTGFLFTEESGLPLDVKLKILEEKESHSMKNTILESPVGLLARGMENNLVKKMKNEKIPPTHCMACIKTCKKMETNYCISDALINAVRGNLERGLFFCGSDIDRIDKVLSVDEYIDFLEGK